MNNEIIETAAQNETTRPLTPELTRMDGSLSGNGLD